MRFYVACLLLVSGILVASDEYPSRIPDKIANCYFKPELNNRFRRMPMSMDNLIALIRKVEAHPSTELWDIATTTGTLLKRFRYDGIIDIPDPLPGILPVQRNVIETDKHRLTWSLIPGHESDFPEDSLSEEEKCALHWMISYSVNFTMRAEERSLTPGQRSLERGVGLPPTVDKEASSEEEAPVAHEEHNHTEHETEPESEAQPEAQPEDVEENHHDDTHKTSSAEEATESDSDAGDDWFSHSRKRRETLYGALPHSLHPNERGVVKTKWGTVAVGSLLSGIAAGLRPESVQLRDLIKDPAYTLSETSLNRTAVSPWVVTLAGDMAQTSLLRASKGSVSIIGPRGSWNSSTCSKEYYLATEDPSLMTTAEIYGGIDGLLIAQRIQSWNTDYMKLSTILETYYSKNGVTSERRYRACNRINNFKDMVDKSLLKEQALNSALIYYTKGNADVPQAGPGVKPIDMIGGFVNKTFNQLDAYLNNKDEVTLDFEECFGEEALAEPVPASLVDVTFVVDQSMDNSDIVQQKELIAALVNSMDIRPNGNRLEVVSSSDAAVLAGFELSSNKAALACSVGGIAIGKGERRISDVLGKLRSKIVSDRSKDKQNRVGGSNGRVVMLFVGSFTANSAEKEKIKTELGRMMKDIPDVRLMFVTSANPEEFSQFVQEPEKDIIRLINYISYAAAAPDIAERLRSLPARIVYPACSSFSEASSEKFYNYTGFVKADTIQYLRIDPSQFFTSEPLTLKFQVAYGLSTVCISRSNRKPGSTDTCKSSTTAGETLDFKINQPCRKIATDACQPIYISVKNSIPDSVPCQDRACTSPNDIKFVVTHEGMKCNSATAKLVSHLLLVLALLFCFSSKRKA